MLNGILSLAKTAGRLKRVERRGWSSWVGVRRPESVAEHSFRCTLLAMCIGDLKGLSTEKLMKTMLLHDLHEALTGDYDYFDKKKLGEEEVRKREREAIRNVLLPLPKNLRDEYLSLWHEFESQRTEEARLAGQIDKLEMVMQALEYEKEGYDSKRLQVFWENMRTKLKDPILKKLFELLEKDRTPQGATNTGNL